MRANDAECGCAPTHDEWRAFATPVSRRTALGLTIVGALGIGAAASLVASPAFADEYPTWEDVEKAMANEQAKAAEISRIEKLIADLTADVAYKQAEAERLMSEFIVAQEAFEDAVARAESLQAQADAEAILAREAAQKLGKLAAQEYRTGGDDTSLELFFSGSAASADDLLARLGTMDKIVEANRAVHTEAVRARDNAQNLSNQAAVARDERDRLQVEAQRKMESAQAAAIAAQAALDTQTANLDVLQAQLAALRDSTATTVAGYEAGVEARRKAEEERQRRLREEEEARRVAREAEAQRQRDAAAAAAAAGGGGGGGGGGSSSGGGGGGGGGVVNGTGWARPHGGWINDGYGPRPVICSGGGCSSGFHRGVDFSAGCWDAIYAASSGTVSFAAYSGTWGNYVMIDHGGGIQSAYAHIANGGYNVGNGQYVNAGDVIAYVGTTGASTGCHLHFEIYRDGARIDPVPFMADRGVYL
ncbi:M23 family metallopeptidase [Microbacterium sp. No. 7]|uniref:M23 family metallopeptidase n=1 Tax=Microbacterium sp. No. 7 TaxID=1714373 RepID=UPI0006ECE41B|nr:peptidase M23 [Microbacterium sp. No. 7]